MAKINEYPQAVTINNNDLFVIDQESGGDHATKSASVSQIADKATSGVQTQIGDLSDLTTSDKSSVVDAINEIATYTPVYGNTASGAIATFDTSLALPLQNCTIAINAVETGTGTKSPSNPYTISGFTGANIHVADNENPHIIDNVTTITWQTEAGTIYGGSLDVTSGVLTVTWGFVDLGDLSWSYNSTYQYFMNSTTITNFKGSTTMDDRLEGLLCEAYPFSTSTSYNTMTDKSMLRGTGNLVLKNTDYTDTGHFKTSLTGVKLIYELANPQTYQLIPNSTISAIVGTNNVFTDTNGNTSVMYACSLKDYIDGQ